MFSFPTHIHTHIIQKHTHSHQNNQRQKHCVLRRLRLAVAYRLRCHHAEITFPLRTPGLNSHTRTHKHKNTHYFLIFFLDNDKEHARHFLLTLRHTQARAAKMLYLDVCDVVFRISRLQHSRTRIFYLL